MRTFYWVIFCVFILLQFGCGQSQQDPIIVEEAWIREAPPNASAMAGYMHIINRSDQDRNLIAAKSDAFKVIEFHRSVEKDGVYHMVRHKYLPIPAHGKFELKPGDFHLMMISPKQVLRDGDRTSVELIFDDQSTITLDVAVKKAVFN